MNRRQLEHLIRAASTIADDPDIVIIGSQAILGQHPDAPASLLRSMEADVYPLHSPERADLIDGSIGEGSPTVVAQNGITLVASRLPLNALGYFLASRARGFVANAGGSQGNLCLGGAVGRFNGSTFNTGITGAGTLQVDLQRIPSPSGLISVVPGETWHF